MRPCVFVVVVALCCSVARADEAEDAAVKWVQGVGGKVARDEKAPGKPVVAVNLPFNKKVTDDGLKHLKGLKSLKTLDLFFNEQITDAGMKHVKELPTLTTLVLNNTSVGDAGLAELKEFKNLTALRLAGCVKMTDACADTIKGFTNLEALALPSTVTETGVKKLAGLKQLKNLYIGGAKLTDDAVKVIGENMPELESLELGALDGTNITDASLPHLAKLKKLKKLGLQGSKVTASGLKALREKLPDCTITTR